IHRTPQPRVINTDQARLYGSAIAAVKEEGTRRRRCRHRPVQYLNNILEQDHRAIKRRVKAKQSFRAYQAARRTIEGYEAVHMIRKGRCGGSATLMFANKISSSTSCSIWVPETSPPSSSRGVLRHRFESCNTSLRTARLFWFLISMATALPALLLGSARLLFGKDYKLSGELILIPLFLCTRFILPNFDHGQINLIVFALL